MCVHPSPIGPCKPNTDSPTHNSKTSTPNISPLCPTQAYSRSNQAQYSNPNLAQAQFRLSARERPSYIVHANHPSKVFPILAWIHKLSGDNSGKIRGYLVENLLVEMNVNMNTSLSVNWVKNTGNFG